MSIWLPQFINPIGDDTRWVRLSGSEVGPFDSTLDEFLLRYPFRTDQQVLKERRT